MRVAIAQLNTTVGALSDNTAKIQEAYEKGVAAQADLIVVPELAITGYPPRDLLLKPHFVEKNLTELKMLASITSGPGLIVGHVVPTEKRIGRPLYNAVSLLSEGKVLATRYKSLLPSYDVFDEDRYFEPAEENTPVDFKGHRIGLTICEDAWNDPDFWSRQRYGQDPIDPLLSAGCNLIVNIAASPWQLEKPTCCSTTNPPRYEPIHYGDYVTSIYQRIFAPTDRV